MQRKRVHKKIQETVAATLTQTSDVVQQWCQLFDLLRHGSSVEASTQSLQNLRAFAGNLISRLEKNRAHWTMAPNPRSSSGAFRTSSLIGSPASDQSTLLAKFRLSELPSSLIVSGVSIGLTC